MGMAQNYRILQASLEGLKDWQAATERYHARKHREQMDPAYRAELDRAWISPEDIR
jgi:hypothetical protein